MFLCGSQLRSGKKSLRPTAVITTEPGMMESAEASAASLSTAAATSIGVSLACSAAQQALGTVADARCVGVFLFAEQVMMHYDPETPRTSVQLLT